MRGVLARRRIRFVPRVVDDRCAHHEHAALLALFDEPNGTNPPKLIGYVCRTCTAIFTDRFTPSQPKIQTKPKVPNSPERPSKAHAARLRAVDRLGIPVVATAEAA